MTIRSLRERIDLYSRRRWTEPQLHEIEVAVMGAAVLVALMALFVVWGQRG